MKNKRMLVWAHGDWQLCYLEKGQWLYAGTGAWCCYATADVITHKLPPKP